MRVAVLIAVVFACSIEGLASTRLFFSKDYAWLLENSDVVVEASGGMVVPSRDGDSCKVIEVTISSFVKGTLAEGVVRATYPDSEFIDRCVAGEPCPALKKAVLYLVAGSPLCQQSAHTVLGLHVTETEKSLRAAVDVAREYLVATDKVAWARAAVAASPRDPMVVRSALAATFKRSAEDPAVRALLRQIALNDAVAEDVRGDAFKVMDVTRSPDKADIIRSIQDTKASPMLKRESLDHLDFDDKSRAILDQLKERPDVGGHARLLLFERSPNLRSQPSTHLLVDDPETTAFAQMMNLMRSTHHDGAKGAGMATVMERLTAAEQERVVKRVAAAAVTPKEKNLIYEVQMLVKELKP